MRAQIATVRVFARMVGDSTGLLPQPDVFLGALAGAKFAEAGSDMNPTDPKSGRGPGSMGQPPRPGERAPHSAPESDRIHPTPVSMVGGAMAMTQHASTHDPASSGDGRPKSIPPPSAPVDPYVGTTIDARYR